MHFKFKLPDIGEGLHEAEIVRWLVKPGDRIEADQVVAEIQTDKAVVEIPSPVGGKIGSLAGDEGSVVHVGEVLITVEEEKEMEPAPALPEARPEQKKKKRALAAPTVRKLARELGIDIEQVTGTGPGGRVMETDIRIFIQPVSNENSNRESHSDPVLHTVESANLEEEIPFQGLRKRISEKMVQSVYTAPQATGMDEIDVTQLVELKESLLPYAEAYGCKLTYLPFIIKAVTKTLKEQPYFNASLKPESGKIILKKYYNIGIATATKDGLIVPVIKNADQKSILEIALELEQLVEKVRQRRVDAADLQGGTFTISSTGKKGGWFATPIINYPEVAILGVHAIKERPAVINHQIAIRSMMGMSLTFDHRVIDGEHAGKFMESFSHILENPQALYLEVR
ncbi:dihydrolipoamide acetyltransferase family protein [Aneurinibacillus tyrosinisolvens]|uniref:dihydrolipoamide acetyltransferase family protein n=1 Tax=Aneurinibacillus tyrosinisolvens TaxID=1443435 RepID=UPI00063FBD42|nr:dihydrolipoamide acetyltransferase family protein [Aneurinibacillus tyrosinisolvens]